MAALTEPNEGHFLPFFHTACGIACSVLLLLFTKLALFCTYQTFCNLFAFSLQFSQFIQNYELAQVLYLLNLKIHQNGKGQKKRHPRGWASLWKMQKRFVAL
ncbi:MAG: hypothetical protein H6654_03915 [Ardenticatenaceae bacterium]|nr:hypothetical protein [Ardenticatenaceae bacterium]